VLSILQVELDQRRVSLRDDRGFQDGPSICQRFLKSSLVWPKSGIFREVPSSIGSLLLYAIGLWCFECGGLPRNGWLSGSSQKPENRGFASPTHI
jgi:hypothetical protein